MAKHKSEMKTCLNNCLFATRINDNKNYAVDFADVICNNMKACNKIAIDETGLDVDLDYIKGHEGLPIFDVATLNPGDECEFYLSAEIEQEDVDWFKTVMIQDKLDKEIEERRVRL